MVGNGVTNWVYDTEPSWVDTYNGFKMISSYLYNQIQENNCFYNSSDFTGHDNGDSTTCGGLWNQT